MIRKGMVILMAMAALPAYAFAPTADQCSVNVRWPDASRSTLEIEGRTYRAALHCDAPGLTVYDLDGREIANVTSESLDVGGAHPTGPGRVNIYNFGTQMYEIHLRDLQVAGFDAGEVELALFCYGDRLFWNLNVRTYDGTSAPSAGIAVATGPATLLAADETDDAALAATARADGLCAAVFTPEQPPQPTDGTWADAGMAAVIGETPDAMLALLRHERHADEVRFALDGGVYDGYQASKGFHQVTTDFTGPRGFEEAWINPNQRIEVDMRVSAPFGAELICNVQNAYGVLEAAVLTDADGFPLPVQVQVCKNFGGEFEEGRDEGDAGYGHAYAPLRVGPDAPFEGRMYHLFGNWGTHPLKQISSIRFFHHYFHASLGPTETLCYVPFEYPRDDDRNYVLADVRGISSPAWPGQPQHDHVSVVGAMRYRSGGKWVNNLLQRTRIFATAPNLASFALDYLSEDGKVETSLEIFELPQDDETRCFIRMRLKALDTVELDAPSAHHLRFVNAGAYIVQTRWPKVAFTGVDGTTQHRDVPETEAWVLEAEPLGAAYPFAAAYPHKHGNMAFFVNRFEGVLGGEPVEQFGLSCFGGKSWTELFLTAPREITRLEKGDWFDAHLFVMPHGSSDTDYRPAERQRALYGEQIAKVTVAHGERLNAFPARIKADSRGFAQFTLEDGDNWIPLLVEGFDSHKAPMLWERRGSWLFHDQQVHGNDWYQSYRAEDGSVGYVFVVKVRPGQTHDYLVTTVPSATAITQRNGYVTVEGGPMDFLSPVPFDGLTCTEVPGTELFRCVGDAARATALR